MAADARSFGIGIGINAAICAIILLFFCFARLRRITRKFYMPRQFIEDRPDAGKPRSLPKKFWGWVKPAWRTDEAEIIRVAGYDGAMYVKIVSLAFEVFTWIALWMLIIVLPTNLVGREVSNLSQSDNVPTSQFTYWVPPSRDQSESGSPPARYSAPKFFAETPPAPAGVQWWKYKDGVPPLPDPGSVLGSNYSAYEWRYDDTYQAQSYTFSQLDKVTLTNIPARSHLLWVHAVACWFVVMIVQRAVWRYSKDAVKLHIMYLRNAKQGVETHSVMVTDIPGTYAGTVSGIVPEKVRQGISRGAEKSRIGETLASGTNFLLPSSVPYRRSTSSFGSARTTVEDVENGTDVQVSRVPELRIADLDAWVDAQRRLADGASIEEFLRQEYNELYEGDVDAVHSVFSTNKLDDLVQEYNTKLRNLEDLIDSYASQLSRSKLKKRATTLVFGACYGKWGKQHYGGFCPTKTDSLEFYVKRLEELRRRITMEQDNCSRKPGPTAFVTFKSRRSQTIASNALQHPDVKSWHVTAAPEPDDIIWDNVRLRAWEKQSRFIIIWVLFIVMALFYTIPIGAVQAIIEVQRLEKIGFFRALINISFIRSIIEAILPGLVLNIFLAILPFIINFMNKQQGMISWSQVDFGLNRKYFIFLIITVFFGSIIGGTLFNQFNQWIDSPQSAVTILGTAAPLTSIFFLTYINLQAFTSLPLSFLRLFGLVLYWIRYRIAATPRAKARVWSEQKYEFGKELPRHMLIFFVGVVFSVVNPLVPIMAIIYFTVAILLERYNMLYIFSPRFDSGGKIWREVYAQVLTALVFFELMMIALLAIKKSFSAVLVAPLPIITIIFWTACQPVFELPLSVLSLRTAVDMDHNDKLKEGEVPLGAAPVQPRGQRKRATYLMPAMDFDEAHYDSVTREAEDMDLALQGKKEMDLQEFGEDIESGSRDAGPSAGGATAAPQHQQTSSAKRKPESKRTLLPSQQEGRVDSASLSNLHGNGQSEIQPSHNGTH